MNLSPDSFVVELCGDVETLGLGQRKAGAKLPICILVRPELKFQPGCFPHAGPILQMASQHSADAVVAVLQFQNRFCDSQK
jgi:hypothetical protein